MALQKRRQLYGYAFISPWLLGLVFIFAVPLVQSVIFAFSDVHISGTGGYELSFVGLKNFKDALTYDEQYPQDLLSSIGDLVYNVPVIIVFSFFVSVLLKQKFPGSVWVKGIFFLPIILSSGLFLQMQSNFGQSTTSTLDAAISSGGNLSILQSVNMEQYLIEMGVPDNFIAIIIGPINRIYEIISNSGIQIFIFLAGLNSISPSLYEASYVEGGTGWEVFWKITFPMMTPLLLVNIIYSIIDTFTSVGNTVMQYVYSMAFTEMNFGMSNAMCWIYLLVLAVFMGIVAGIMSKRIFYYT